MITLKHFESLETEDYILNRITENDKAFLETLFIDSVTEKYFIIPENSKSNKNLLIEIWNKDFLQNSGICWVIKSKKDNNNCGIISFQFQRNVKTVRLNIIIEKEYRLNNIAKNILLQIINILSVLNVDVFEADIDAENNGCIKLFEGLNFTTDKSNAFIDPFSNIDDLRIRYLFKLENYKSSITLNASCESLSNNFNGTYLINTIKKFKDNTNDISCVIINNNIWFLKRKDGNIILETAYSFNGIYPQPIGFVNGSSMVINLLSTFKEYIDDLCLYFYMDFKYFGKTITAIILAITPITFGLSLLRRDNTLNILDCELELFLTEEGNINIYAADSFGLKPNNAVGFVDIAKKEISTSIEHYELYKKLWDIELLSFKYLT